MSKDQKRYRQINIIESFALCKKTRTNVQVPTMEQNLRDLMAVAAESRLSTQKNEIPQKIDDINSNINHGASTSKDTPNHTESVIQDPEENVLQCSAEIFPDSPESQYDSPVVEQCSSQETETCSITAPSSPEVFSQIEDIDSNSQNLDNDEEEDEEEVQADLEFFNRRPDCSLPLPKLEPLENHAIMFSPHIRPGDAPRPYPATYRDMWDGNHVRMPCSPLNKYPVENLNGDKEIRSRWELIRRSLTRPIHSTKDLVNAITQYNSQYRSKWNFNNLYTILDEICAEDERLHFFEVILPQMISMALDLPNICTQPLPLLKKDKDYKVTMSQKQIACLLLNAFFCTFPRRIVISRRLQKWSHEYSNYPDINFNRLFNGVKTKNSTSIEKLKCIINYFSRIASNEPTGTVTFHRQHIKNFPKWQSSTKKVRSVVIKSKGLIENEGHGMLQVDFANKFVGGGVLGQGCVQEEIRFVICPELLVSRLFVECLSPSEVLIIKGVEQFNDYTGYSSTFEFIRSFRDQTPRDAWGRRCTEVVAMDATHFSNTLDQFKLSSVLRELNKAYCGFYEDGLPANLPAVATGNWGCGAFNGNPVLKFIIQLIAASETQRDVLYLTFGNRALKRELRAVAGFLVGNDLVVGDLIKILISYCKMIQVTRQDLRPKICDFLQSYFLNQNSIDNAISDEKEQSQNTITDSYQDAIDKLLDAVDNSYNEDDTGSLSNHG